MKRQFNNKKRFNARPPHREGDGRTGRDGRNDWKKDDRRRYDNGKGRDYKEKNEGTASRPWEKRKNKNNFGRDYKEKFEKKENKPWQKRDSDKGFDKRKKFGDHSREREQKPWEKRREDKWFDKRKKKDENLKKAFDRSEKNFSHTSNTTVSEGAGLTRLNKYLSNAGICSRREADTFIAAGTVKVNGKIITQLGYKVAPGDKVQFGDNTVRKEKSVYILLNKPKGYITTTDDERDRATVMELIQGIEERIYPIGRLDRNTSGLLILTNDGELAKILMHPKYRVAKVYHVILDKPLKPDDLDSIKNGIELEDGFIKPDDVAYVEGSESKKEVGIEIHSGRNRIVRRIFEHLGYVVEKLDRVLYAGLTKKNLGRGKWRLLAENEVRMLKRIK